MGRLNAIKLATAPDATSMPGICEAQVLELGFSLTSPIHRGPDGGLEDAEVQVDTRNLLLVFGVGGDTASRLRAEGSGEDNRSCARLHALDHFFVAQDAVQAWKAVRVLERVRVAGPDFERGWRFRCETSVGCMPERDAIAALRADRIISVYSMPCASDECMTLMVELRRAGSEQTVLTLSAKIAGAVESQEQPLEPTIRDISGVLTTWAED